MNVNAAGDPPFRRHIAADRAQYLHGGPCGAVEYQERADARIDYICERLLPELHQEGLVDAVDAFCETRHFRPRKWSGSFRRPGTGAASEAHAEQLTLQHGAALAARYHALSADHLEYLCEEDIAAMARHGTVAVKRCRAPITSCVIKQLPPLIRCVSTGCRLPLQAI